MNNIELNVLWVEDKESLHIPYCMEAESAPYFLKLVPFTCWEDAEKELTGSSFDKWSAIILDAKCKYRRSDSDKAERFLPQVFVRLSKIYNEKNHTIPWYVLSGGGAEVGPIEDLIVDERLKWDSDWPKKYYSKNTERSTLFTRIRKQASLSNKLQIESILYPNLFDAIKDIKLDACVSQYMLELLGPIHFDILPDNLYKDGFYKARKILEYIFLSMINNGILPPEIKMKSDKGDINLTWASLFLSGKTPIGTGWVYQKIVFDKVTSMIVKSILEVTGSYLHVGTRSQKDILDVGKHIKYTNDSPYLLRGIVFQLVDVILWYKKYLEENPDKEENKNYWTTDQISSTYANRLHR